MFRSVVVPFLLSAEPIGEAIPIQDGSSDEEDLRMESKIRNSVAAVKQKSRAQQSVDSDFLGFKPKRMHSCHSRADKSISETSRFSGLLRNPRDAIGDAHDDEMSSISGLISSPQNRDSLSESVSKKFCDIGDNMKTNHTRFSSFNSGYKTSSLKADADMSNKSAEARKLRRSRPAAGDETGSSSSRNFPPGIDIADTDFVETKAPLPASRIMEQLSLWRKLATKTMISINLYLPPSRCPDDHVAASVNPSMLSCTMVTSVASCIKMLRGPERRRVCGLAGQMAILYTTRKVLKDLAFKDPSSCIWRLIHSAMDQALAEIPPNLIRQKRREEKSVEKAEEKLQLRIGAWEILRSVLKTRSAHPELDNAKTKDEMAYTSYKIICLTSFCLDNQWRSLSDIPEKSQHSDAPLRLPQNFTYVLNTTFDILRSLARSRDETRDIDSMHRLLRSSEVECEQMTCAFLDDAVGDLGKMLEIYNLLLVVVQRVGQQHHQRAATTSHHHQTRAGRGDCGPRLIGNIYLLMQKTCQLIHSICLPPAVVPTDPGVMSDEHRLLHFIAEAQSARSIIKLRMNSESRRSVITEQNCVRANNLLLWLYSYLSAHLMDHFQDLLKQGKTPQPRLTAEGQPASIITHPKDVYVALETLKTLAAKHFGQDDPSLSVIHEYRAEMRSVVSRIIDTEGSNDLSSWNTPRSQVDSK
ncbi:unnamed protein product [Notodromas monacha]|uniref:Uncharacterized protein n=1 Tax=Notodromas monacha TaxID=399045 RepID=A0A7R9BT12_9CRUS|nr:unnamed protein product [Notodromas monacha]CAG0919821.1 unnamed protein product [Notodromas monacha]